MNTLVAIPTYNEKGNVSKMIDSVLGLNGSDYAAKLGVSFSLVIIDDNSPDGTGAIVKNRIEETEKRFGKQQPASGGLFIIERENKQGLGTAYAAAFKFAIENKFDYVITMDCDFSHDPAEIPGMFECAVNGKYGMVIGSRYKDGVRVINWSMKRLLISYFANVYAKLVSGLKITDLTGGFNLYNASCLKKINLDGIASRGYAFQIEMKYRLARDCGCTFGEYPIVFYERTSGKSKMSRNIIFEAFFGVIKLRLGIRGRQ